MKLNVVSRHQINGLHRYVGQISMTYEGTRPVCVFLPEQAIVFASNFSRRPPFSLREKNEGARPSPASPRAPLGVVLGCPGAEPRGGRRTTERANDDDVSALPRAAGEGSRCEPTIRSRCRLSEWPTILGHSVWSSISDQTIGEGAKSLKAPSGIARAAAKSTMPCCGGRCFQACCGAKTAESLDQRVSAK
jgi:hypothetical protein